MGTQWFYLREDERLGPFTLEELIQVLQATPDPHAVLVWDPRRADWQPAGSVVEIAGHLPPPLPSLPPRNPAVQPQPVPFETAEKIAKLYRRLVLLVGSQLLLGYFVLLPAGATESAAGGLLALVASLALLGVTVAMVVTTYRLAASLDAGAPALWAAGMFFGCVAIILLLVLSYKAQAWCRQYGIKVGFFGPTKESIEELKRKGMTSAFD